MNFKIVRPILALALGMACSTWLPAQEGNSAAKTNPAPKVSSDAQLKAQAKQRAVKAKAAELAKAVDLNHASKAELKKLRGITDAYAEAILAKRPYKSKADLVVKNAIPMDLYQTIRKQVAVKQGHSGA